MVSFARSNNNKNWLASVYVNKCQKSLFPPSSHLTLGVLLVVLSIILSCYILHTISQPQSTRKATTTTRNKLISC